MTRTRMLPNGAARSVEAALPEPARLDEALRELARHLDAAIDGDTLAERTDGLARVLAWSRERAAAWHNDALAVLDHKGRMVYSNPAL
ncbi:MAG: hypothetical protein ABL977_06865, partial [Candidatus Eisenbacteria bacterium]